MCGLAYAHNLSGAPVNNDILNIFDKQRSRGTEGFGIFDGQENHIIRETREDGILKWLVKYDSDMIMFHHRYPTSTDNVKKAAHPFSTKDFFGSNQYILVHNGMISNSRELKVEHEKLGIEYQSVCNDGRFNDSEALLWDFALTIQGKQPEMKAKGGIAFICVNLRNGKHHRLYFARNSNPLKMTADKDNLKLSSEGDGQMIEAHQLFTYNYKNNKLRHKPFTVPGYVLSGRSKDWEYDDWDKFSGNNNACGYGVTGGKPQDWNWENKKFQKDHFRSYSPPSHTPPRAGTAGDWLTPELHRKYQKYLPSTTDVIENKPGFVDYDRDGSPIFFDDDAYSSYDDYYTQRAKRAGRLLVPDSQIVVETPDEVPEVDDWEWYGVAFDYMAKANGKFSTAYFMAENDYSLMFDVPVLEQDSKYRKDMRILERAMEEINSDPEYVDEKARSSTWNYEAQRLLTV